MSDRLRILVADDLGGDGLEILETAGDVTVRTGMGEAELRNALKGHHALVVRSATKVTAGALEGADQLAVVGRAGIGIDNIDVAAATAKGIAVMNTPEASAVTTGEHALALLISLARKIPAADASIRAGKWDKKAFTGVELQDKVLCVIGLGRIGRVLAEKAQGIGMRVIAHDPYVVPEHAPHGVELKGLEQGLGAADFVSLHLPLTDETKNLLNGERLRAMKPGARLICAARGGMIDEVALAACLEEGHLAGAALDVFEDEPLPENSPLRAAPNTVFTPHLGASTQEAKKKVGVSMAEQIVLCLKKGVALNGVNVPRIAPADAVMLAPFLDLTRNLAALLVQVFPGACESLRLTLQGDLPETAHRPLTVAMLCGALCQGEQRVTQVNAEALAEAQGIRIHTETGGLKRDFRIVIRVEALVDGQRHHASGTVLGRFGRIVELDHWPMDAIPEAPLLLAFHDNQPGAVGRMATALGLAGINIDRMMVGPGRGDGGPQDKPSIGLFNLSATPNPSVLESLSGDPALRSLHLVQ